MNVSVSGIISVAHFWNLFCMSTAENVAARLEARRQITRISIDSLEAPQAFTFEVSHFASLIFPLKIKHICKNIFVCSFWQQHSFLKQQLGLVTFCHHRLHHLFVGGFDKEMEMRGHAEAPHWPLTHANKLCVIPSSQV